MGQEVSRYAVAGLLGLASLIGCALQAPMRLVEADSGKLLTLERGQLLEIHLEGQGGTGYQWTRTGTPAGVLVAEGPAEIIQAQDARPGQAHEEIWRFRGDKPGTELLTLEYRRQWENTAPVRTLSVQVTVR